MDSLLQTMPRSLSVISAAGQSQLSLTCVMSQIHILQALTSLKPSPPRVAAYCQFSTEHCVSSAQALLITLWWTQGRFPPIKTATEPPPQAMWDCRDKWDTAWSWPWGSKSDKTLFLGDGGLNRKCTYLLLISSWLLINLELPVRADFHA